MPPKDKKAESLEDHVKRYGEREIRENFIPVDESDLRGAIDIPVKSTPITEVIEKPGDKIIKKTVKKTRKTKKTSKKKTSKKSKSNGKSWENDFKIPGPKKLSDKGYTLIITEKPQAALKIANALAEGKVLKNSLNNVAYYTLQRNGQDIQVVCAVGHLFSLAQVKARNPWPTFDIKWAPNYLVRKKDFTKRYYDVIAKICKNASEIVVATDYDIEGEVIGLNIVRYICNQDDAGRMKFSTLTSKEIQDAFEKRSASLDWGQGIAGETRHYLDWIYGINLSRALMDAIKTTGKFRLMSIGRVQGPALQIIVNKEKEIQAFKPSKYWDVFLDVSQGGKKLSIKFNKDITKEKELDKFKNLKGRKAIAKTIKTQQKLTPLVPFDLTTLQTESYRLYKITPAKTLEIAQRLYLSGIISYPRTSSQKIPKEIGYDEILNRLKKIFVFVNKKSRANPIEGKKSDPAHPSIYPTGEFHEVDGDDKKIYELIVKRFVACFFSDAILDNKKIEVSIDDFKFNARGMGIREKGWTEIYPMTMKEKEIPDMDGEVNIDSVNIEEKMTQPPKRYSPASIVSELEKKNLGTKATRSSILETLYDRGYIKEKSINATPLGISLIETLEKNSPIIIDEKLTRDLEKDLEQIRNSKKPFEYEKKILDKSYSIILDIGKDFQKHKEEIGKDLVKATENLWEEERKDGEIMQCPSCNKGMLSIKYAKQYSRYFLGCSNYPECNQTYTLPPNGLIKKTDKVCEQCSFNMLMSIRKGKRPWVFCFNPECPSRKDYQGNKEG